MLKKPDYDDRKWFRIARYVAFRVAAFVGVYFAAITLLNIIFDKSPALYFQRPIELVTFTLMTAAILIASIRDYRKRFRMQLDTFNRHNNPGVKAVFAKFASVIRIMSVIYGSCCSLLFCAIVVLLVFGRMSGLGVNLALFALVILWSGIPLMLVSIHSLKTGAMISRTLGIVSFFVLIAPAAVYFFYQCLTFFISSAMEDLGVFFSFTLAFSPAFISLTLFLLLMSLYSENKSALA